MDSKHIERDYSAHRKNVIRPHDEYVKLEIFSFDPKHTQTYLREDNTLKGTDNTTATSWKSWSCFKATDKQNDMIFDISYIASEIGEYRIDLLYEQNNHIHSKIGKKNPNTNKDLVGAFILNDVESKVKFDGENNVIKRKTLFKHFDDGTQKIKIKVPYNCYFMGVIIRKVIKFVGDNYYGEALGSEEGNMVLTDCTVTYSDMTKPKELSCTIFYDDAFECNESPSGFYIDYHDEVNFYVKDNDNKNQRIFGGYVSSILPDSDRTKLTISCADRLIDGQNKYVLDLMRLGGGTTPLSETDYNEHMSKDFDSYPRALKYLCDIHETTLKSNITPSYTVDGEKFHKGLIITYGSSKKIKKINKTNGKAVTNKNYILIRNSPTANKQQVWTLYDAKKNAKTPPKITDYPYMHITYGLGKTKTSYDSETTEKVDTADTTAGSQKFSKYGVSADGKYLMAVGRPSAGNELGKWGYTWYKRTFERKCSYCGSKNIYWSIFWAGNEHDNEGRFPATGRIEGGSAEGHIFCADCDTDWSIFGKCHGSVKPLTAVTKVTKSSKSEAYKLKNGNMDAVPTSSATVTPDDILGAITKLAFKYKYRLGAGSSSLATMKKVGYGDCWAFSELIFTELKKKDVSCKIKQYDSGYAGNHRSVIYKNANGKWVDFPYREQGWGKRYDNMLNNYPIGRSFHGTTIKEHKGGRLSNAKASTSTTKTQKSKVTHTRGYDKDKPFQGYIKLTYSLEQSFTAKKYAVYIKFTQTPSSDYVTTEGFNLYWVNDTINQTTLHIGDDSEDFHDGLIYFLRKAVHKKDDIDVYLQSIHMIAPKVKAKDNKDDTDWYKNDDSNDDQSSCKLDLYQITFDDNRGTDPKELQSCGKSVNAVLQDVVKEAGYYVDITYGLHRKDDQINFRVINNTSEQYTASEGDNNNILAWNSISYSPISALYNMSTCVFKLSDNKYYYIDTKDSQSILNYGEQCTLQTKNEAISKEQAYFNALESDKYNPSQTYTYTITVPNYPNLRIGDLVKVVANAKKLNNVKEVNSIKLSFDNDKMPRLRTEIGLGELAPDIQLRQNIRKLRRDAQKESTSFDSTASPVTDEMYYEWDR